jgi:hypothetical protein
VTKHSSDAKREIADKTTLLRTLVGSTVHGLNIKSQDDIDQIGICIEPPEYVIGPSRFDQYEFRTQPDHVRSGPGDLDLVVYSLRKWMGLAIAGNPSICIPLWVPEGQVVSISEAGWTLRRERKKLLSIRTINAHLGFLRDQRERMLGIRGGMDVTRPELIEMYGFDTKYAGHMVRLGVQGLEIATRGTLTLPMPDPWRSTITAIRTGQFTKDETLEMAQDLENEIRLALPRADLPARVSSEYWTKFMIEAYYESWEVKR